MLLQNEIALSIDSTDNTVLTLVFGWTSPRRRAEPDGYKALRAGDFKISLLNGSRLTAIGKHSSR
jgi:hypothetical protein